MSCPKECVTGNTVSELVRSGTAFLKERKIENADYDCFTLFSHVTGMSRTDYFIKGNESVLENQIARFKELLIMRANHIPLQHLLGTAWFYGYEFHVNGDVLIPRQDTEVLVSEALKVIDSNARILDMCTGSGCILLTLALEKNIAAGYGVDLSEKALAVAKRNMEDLQQNPEDNKLHFLQSNIFQNIDEKECGQLDLLISNPPYIRSDVIPTLSEEVRLHDPMMALDGFEDGLFFYREISKAASRYLKVGGWLMYEIGHDQGKDVSEMMKENGFTDISVIKDLAGLDRVVRGRLS